MYFNKKEEINYKDPMAGYLDKVHEQQVRIYNDQQTAAELKAKVESINEYAEELKDTMINAAKNKSNRSAYLETVRCALLSECMMKLYKESYGAPMIKSDTVFARNMINNFIKENGSIRLMSDWATKNYVLSEFSRICTKHYNRLLETCDEIFNPEDCPQIRLTSDIGMDFFSDLEDLDTIEVSKMIRDKVADAMTEFVDNNLSSRLEYEDLLNTAKDQASTATTEEAAASILNAAQRKINEAERIRPKNVFNYMVESLVKSSFKDEALKAKFINETTVDMEAIVESVKLMYTMLEMVNTTNMVNVDGEYIKRYLQSLSK